MKAIIAVMLQLGIASPTLTFNPYPNFVIQCKDGSVTISTKDGSVILDHCTADDAAKAFWRAITKQFHECPR
jgi:hypothetical protein